MLDTATSVAIFAQRNKAVARNNNADDAAGGFMAMLAIYFVILAIIAIPTIAGMWKTFTKAGQPGWAAIIPIYNVYVMNQVAKKEPLWFILYIVGAIIPCLNIISLVAIVVINMEVAKKFGKGAGYGIGLSFLPFIFWPMLGFGDARYQAGRRRDYDDDDDYDDEDDRPKKKKGRDYDDEDEDDRPRNKKKSRDYDDE